MRQLLVVTTAAMMVACGESTPVKPVTVAEESAPAPLTTNTPAPKPPLVACIESKLGLTANPGATADGMIFEDEKGAGVVKIVRGGGDREAVAREGMPHYKRAHRIGNYYFEFPGGKGDRTAIRNCMKENTSTPPLMACIEATGLTVKPLSTADHMIFKDKGTFAVKVVLGEALANQTMAHPERAHRIGRYFFEFHGGKVDRTAIRTCIKENK
jgi:hypothetical protein